MLQVVILISSLNFRKYANKIVFFHSGIEGSSKTIISEVATVGVQAKIGSTTLLSVQNRISDV